MKATPKTASKITSALYYVDGTNYGVNLKVENDYEYYDPGSESAWPYGVRLSCYFNRDANLDSMDMTVQESSAYATAGRLTNMVLPTMTGVTLKDFCARLESFGIGRWVYDPRQEKNVRYDSVNENDAGWTDDITAYESGSDFPVQSQIALYESEARAAVAAYMAKRNGSMVARFQAWVMAGCPVVRKTNSLHFDTLDEIIGKLDK